MALAFFSSFIHFVFQAALFIFVYGILHLFIVQL